jgi:hypothetical protein
VGLREEIFPTEPREAYVQTEWAPGWGFVGLGYRHAAAFLTRERKHFGPSIDQVGLAIFFLQRHCVELALKELLDYHGVGLQGINSPHSLVALWYACQDVVGAGSEGWKFLEKEGGELVELLDDADPGSYTFRYPVDNKGVELKRPEFIDLDALATHVDDLVSAIDGYIDYHSEEGRAKQEYEDEMGRDADR